jgi:hypothetical protein
MWVFLSRSFLSIVAHRDKPNHLLVRARIKGDIEAVFPNAEVFTDDTADYLYRAVITRAEVGEKMKEVTEEIYYDNFKASVVNPRRHDAYMDVWGIMNGLQQ